MIRNKSFFEKTIIVFLIVFLGVAKFFFSFLKYENDKETSKKPLHWL